MSRKRSGKKKVHERNESNESKKIKPKIQQKKKTFLNKKVITAISLIGIMCLVLFMNTYFNYVSGDAYNPEGESLGTKFYLSGPDPYYNMRLCQQTIEQGHYPFLHGGDYDPLLNYPVGHKYARPPLFNMFAVASSNLVSVVSGMEILDALGWCMLFLPAIYGALLIFPVYGIGKEIFNKKVGMIAAFLVPLIPIHIGAGHGSSFSLFDHDSFLLLLFTMVFYFFIKSLKEEDRTKGIIYAALAGVTIGAIQLTWVAAQVIFLTLCIFLVVYVAINILRSKYDLQPIIKVSIILGVGFLISAPYMLIIEKLFQYPFLTFMFSLGVLVFYYVLKKINWPWLITIPSTVGLGICGLFVLYLVSIGTVPIGGALLSLSNVVFGAGIYGSQVSLTIGEAFTFGLSQTVMSFGPALYWLGLIGFVIFLYKTWNEKWKPQYLFLIIVFIVNFWLTTIASRFLNDLIPSMCVFAAFFVGIVVDKLDFKSLAVNIKRINSIKNIHKVIKIPHVMGIFFICFILLLPNTYLALDASVPPAMDEEVFGEGFQGVWGNNLMQQYYWSDALYWLSQQDTEIEKPGDRPAIMTWWDYGFYTSSMGEHPSVSDNYQSGIPPAANFLCSQTESEAISVMMVRLIDGVIVRERNAYTTSGTMPDNVKDVFEGYLEPYVIAHTEEIDGNETFLYNETIYPAQDIINIIEKPFSAPSCDTCTCPEWGNTELTISAENAMYHDSINILTDRLTEEKIVQMYMDIKDVTGFSIKYFGIEYRDIHDIFSVFPFLADRGVHGYITGEDDFYKTEYVDQNTGETFSLEQIMKMSDTEKLTRDFKPKMTRKEGFYNSMAYKGYVGMPSNDGSIPQNRIPGYLLKHWALTYSSPYLSILTYYEGATINGSVFLGENKENYDGTVVWLLDENYIPHDYSVVQNGNFSVLAPAGNISLQVFIGEQNITEPIKIEFPVTEEEATRQVPRTQLPSLFNINTSNVNFSVSFNSTYANETCTNYTGIQTMLVESNIYTYVKFEKEIQDGNNTFYFEDLIPSKYTVTIKNDNCTFYTNSFFFAPNNNTFDIVVGG